MNRRLIIPTHLHILQVRNFWQHLATLGKLRFNIMIYSGLVKVYKISKPLIKCYIPVLIELIPQNTRPRCKNIIMLMEQPFIRILYFWTVKSDHHNLDLFCRIICLCCTTDKFVFSFVLYFAVSFCSYWISRHIDSIY